MKALGTNEMNCIVSYCSCLPLIGLDYFFSEYRDVTRVVRKFSLTNEMRISYVGPSTAISLLHLCYTNLGPRLRLHFDQIV
jgi:hypothetical protein